MSTEKPSGRSGRWSLFITGLALGIALGGAAMWWMENYIRKNSHVSYYQYNPSDTEVPEPLADLNGTPAVDLAGASGMDDFSEDNVDSLLPFEEELALEPGLLDSLEGLYYTPSLSEDDDVLDDYRQWPAREDSLRQQTSRGTRPRELTADETPVMRDELLFVRQLIVLLEKKNADGIVSRIPEVSRPWRVEFWRSPVNYTGYRMADHKLVLFGIYAVDSVILLRKNDSLWLNVMDERYHLLDTYEFKPLINVKKPMSKSSTRQSGRP